MPQIRSVRALIPVTLALAAVVLRADEPLKNHVASAWSSDSVLEDVKALTMEGLGAMQGVSFHEDKVYLYGDCYDVKPRVGVIREYSSNYEATGRVIWLRTNEEKTLLRHPTGLTWHKKWGTFSRERSGARS